ncbi:MAG: TolC family protein [Chitinophagaceae bacterium]
MKLKIITIISLFSAKLFAQEKQLSLQQFIEQIKQYHPIAKQANILVEKAKAEILIAKGEFDPTIYVDASRKTLDEKNYYFYTNPELKVPLPIGNVKTGIEDNGGDRMSSELTPGKSSYFGVDIPLAKGLLIDKRRAALKQAKIYKSQSEQEKLIVLNNLLYDAYSSYIQWLAVYKLNSIYNNFLKISSDRLRLIKITAANGDRSPMDTLEAFTQLQNIQMQQADAQLKLLNAQLEISNFLWNEKDSAVTIDNKTIPVEIVTTSQIDIGETIVNSALQQSPIIKFYNFKLDALSIEQRLKKQNLLPYINAKANLLNKDYAVFNSFNSATIQNNYKWGIDVKIPLFFREGRGEVRKAKLKIAETNLELNYKKLQIQNKILAYQNEYLQLQKQVKIANTALNNYNSLYRNELLKFSNGESSLFIVNSRENKVLEMQQKTTELQAKLSKAKYAIDWASGLLN